MKTYNIITILTILFTLLQTIPLTSAQGGCCCPYEWVAEIRNTMITTNHGRMYYSLDKTTTRIDMYEGRQLLWQYLSYDKYHGETSTWFVDYNRGLCSHRNESKWVQLCYDQSNYQWELENVSKGVYTWQYKPQQSMWQVIAPCNPVSINGAFEFLPSFNVKMGPLKVKKLPPDTWDVPKLCK
eukprot:TRINITY_DN8049_c0_g1_i1.p1 TRINITY_DN8049_c0_g1~~TRINITY_DN8049_c0_g1_i1.p1  ORF type:complete len:183 (-),score=7.09 TRINITY_DN8049_c0_g1_i1:63-611(-)